jgi:folate-binding protein YgfZ
MTHTYIAAPDRGVLLVKGPDARPFLQGLVSNDVTAVGPERAIYAAFLTPQGRYLHDFFIAELDGGLALDGEAERLPDLKRRLSVYRLRSKVELIEAGASWSVVLVPDDWQALGLDPVSGRARALDGGIAFIDPRLAALGARAILPRTQAEAILASLGLSPGQAAAYDALRLSLGIPDGSRDLEVERALLLENGFDELAGIDWNKGCYMGQELTARTKYRALIRKRLLPVVVEGPLPPPGTPVTLNGAEAGEVRSGRGGRALALLRLDMVEAAAAGPEPLRAGAARLRAAKPGWARF